MHYPVPLIQNQLRLIEIDEKQPKLMQIDAKSTEINTKSTQIDPLLSQIDPIRS